MYNSTKLVTWAEKIKHYFMQPANVILRRKGSEVTEHLVEEFFSSSLNRIHDIHDCAVFCYAVYGEVNEGTAVVDNVPIKIPSTWKSFKELPQVPNKGLRFHVWENLVDRKIVIAFRGTRPTSLSDWIANFRWITRFLPGVSDHYDKVRAFIPAFVEYVHQRHGKDIAILATGHSLGGGLAQQAAYSSPYVNHVYAFAPTPVTGYKSVKKKQRIINEKDTYIARIFEHGEVLAYLRFLMRKLYKISEKDPEIVEIRFNFLETNAISEHSMGKFAENIKQNIRRRDHLV